MAGATGAASHKKMNEIYLAAQKKRTNLLNKEKIKDEPQTPYLPVETQQDND